MWYLNMECTKCQFLVQEPIVVCFYIKILKPMASKDVIFVTQRPNFKTKWLWFIIFGVCYQKMLCFHKDPSFYFSFNTQITQRPNFHWMTSDFKHESPKDPYFERFSHITNNATCRVLSGRGLNIQSMLPFFLSWNMYINPITRVK